MRNLITILNNVQPCTASKHSRRAAACTRGKLRRALVKELPYAPAATRQQSLM